MSTATPCATFLSARSLRDRASGGRSAISAIAGSITAAVSVNGVKTMLRLCVNCATLDFE